MHLKFSVLASLFLDAPETMKRAVFWPVLVWEAPLGSSTPLAVNTATGRAPTRPTASEPLVLEVRRRVRREGHSPEVTLGRTQDNDIIVQDPTVSRLHASFYQEQHTGTWYVSDAGSHNGTWNNGTLLIPGRPEPLFERASLRFGDVLATFLQPDTFHDFVLARMARVAQPLPRTRQVGSGFGGGLTRAGWAP